MSQQDIARAYYIALMVSAADAFELIAESLSDFPNDSDAQHARRVNDTLAQG